MKRTFTYMVSKIFNTETVEGKWMLNYSILLLSMLLIYVLLHNPSIVDEPKKQTVGLSQDQINFIIGLKSDDNIKNKDELIKNFLRHSGYSDSVDFESINQAINNLPLTELNIYLNSYRFNEDAPFWLTGYYVFVEITFWSLFGVLASLLFHGTEAIRKGVFDKREQSVHWAKLLYSPIVTIVLILSVEALTEGGGIKLDGLNYWLIVLSFIFGYYSRKSIDLLDRLKDIVFRSSEFKDQGNQSATTFDKLSNEEKKRVLRLAKTNLQKEWVGKYDGLHSVKVDTKNNSDDWRLIFIVDQVKKDSTLISQVPSFISFTENGVKYELPTAVVGAGSAQNQLYNPNQPKQTGINIHPKQPGCSISRSRNDTKATGTICLKVFREDNGAKKFYLLSCYHVLCSLEFENAVFDLKDSTEKNFDVLAPSKKDGGGNVLAVVTEGRSTNYLDAAIAELSSPIDLSPAILNTIGPTGKLVIGQEHEGISVVLSGRTSGYQTGKVIEYSTFVTVDGHTTYDVIMTSKLSEGGDSGACVIDSFGRIIGMLKAGDAEHSYIIPIERILTYLNITPCYV